MDSAQPLPSHWRFPGFRSLFASAAVGIGAVLIAAPLTAFSQHVLHQPPETLQIASALVLMTMVPLEEWFFRGVVLRQLLRFGRVLAVSVSAAAFAAVHLSAVGFLPRLAGGLVLGVLYLRTLSLWAPIAAHLTYNTAIVTLALLARF